MKHFLDWLWCCNIVHHFLLVYYILNLQYISEPARMSQCLERPPLDWVIQVQALVESDQTQTVGAVFELLGAQH